MAAFRYVSRRIATATAVAGALALAAPAGMAAPYHHGPYFNGQPLDCTAVAQTYENSDYAGMQRHEAFRKLTMSPEFRAMTGQQKALAKRDLGIAFTKYEKCGVINYNHRPATPVAPPATDNNTKPGTTNPGAQTCDAVAEEYNNSQYAGMTRGEAFRKLTMSPEFRAMTGQEKGLAKHNLGVAFGNYERCGVVNHNHRPATPVAPPATDNDTTTNTNPGKTGCDAVAEEYNNSQYAGMTRGEAFRKLTMSLEFRAMAGQEKGLAKHNLGVAFGNYERCGVVNHNHRPTTPTNTTTDDDHGSEGFPGVFGKLFGSS